MSGLVCAVFTDGSQIEKPCCGWANPKHAICQPPVPAAGHCVRV